MYGQQAGFSNSSAQLFFCVRKSDKTGSWTEAVEDLVHAGKVDQAISFLESIVSNLENELEKELGSENSGKSAFSIADQLYVALQDLSKLYSVAGFLSKPIKLSLVHSKSNTKKSKSNFRGFHMENESDEIAHARVSQVEATTSDGNAEHGNDENSSKSHNDGVPQDSGEDDDWEAIADRDPDELLSPQCLPEVSKLSLEDSKAQGTKRRGRGTFQYKKRGLYSDNQSDEEPVLDESENDSASDAEDSEKGNLIYGTRHVLVLADFPPSTRTTDLEKLLENFKDRFWIRWVNDSTALAVFRTPSDALEASNSIQLPFTVRVLNEDDEILSSIRSKDLEPPRQRPPTSVITARRMILQSAGIRLSSTSDSSEQRKLEEARKNRIVSRQKMRNDAWGDDSD
ncbi:hypothetical protein DH2020_020994 [Rehmannia glutinosa]|uniref:Coiled-coil domain-containing protein R3HCC1L n=1 Tax=Rehmannia glutinosa TaxID=99300 RepID=A0ABR0WAT6_REHGL